MFFLYMEQFLKIMADKKPYVAMVIVQIIFAGMAIVSKAAFNGGMSTFVFSFYRQAIATILLLPLAIIFARKTAPPLPFKLMIKIFLLSMFGYTINLNMHSIAINLTSATVASAVTNLIPVFTFVLAILFRQESIVLKRLPGIAKMVGVVICLVGAIIIAFYEGPHLNSIHHNPILHRSNQNPSGTSKNNSWIIGSFLMVLVALCWASWIVLQGILLREYPSWIWSSALSSLCSTLQCFIVAIAVERNMPRWKLHWDDGLLAAAYTGVFVAGLNLYLQTLCIHKKGPVFVAMFYPLALVFTISSSSFLLGEAINLGSVLGGGFLVGGLYFVLWGKSREREEISSDVEVAKGSNNSNVEVATGSNNSNVEVA